ncbi:type II toxin-antitoxin system VapC family toxin [Ferroplasma sp.]|uniref:type II toxin-antitoxin system VapC family toxin n=1 Tax=Ferroplasma sp. TaxID=2591003 RepID=UPI00307EA9AC
MTDIFIDANFYIYLNCFTDNYDSKYIELLNDYDTYTNVLAFDEVIYISYKKYNIKFDDTIDFIKNSVIPFTNILDLTINEYKKASEIILNYKTKPSDSLHIATMLNNNIFNILTEDSDFNNIDKIKKIWL